MRNAKGAVLVAVSSAEVRQHMCDTLNSIDPGFAISAVKTTAALRDVISSRPIDLLIMSDQFSGKPSLEIIEQLGTQSHKTLIVMVADHFSEETISQSRKHHLYDCIQTPVDAPALQRVLKRCEAQKCRLSTLIVDSQPTARHLIYKMLSESPFNLTISEAENGALAVSLSKAIRYHILFVDPDSTSWMGPASVKQIMKLQQHCRIVLMSPHDKDLLLQLYEGCEIAGFLKKPFYRKDLERLLHEILAIPAPNLLNLNFFSEQIPLATDEVGAEASKEAEDESEIIWL
nr:response regulator [uncultured Cohaesibacter sp.]